MADPHATLAPNFAVQIEGSDLGRGLSELVQSLEYENVDGIADEARLTISSPELVLHDSSLWQPGNQMDVWFGYGTDIQHVGRVIIARPEPGYPRDDIPAITVKGYTMEFLMMDNGPGNTEPATRDFESIFIHEAVERVAQRYPFDLLDIDPTPGRYASIQKADTKDYEFVKSLSNLTGYLFWVDYTLENKWAFHFRDPTVLLEQEKKYVFQYNLGDKTTLLDFFPELTLSGAVQKLQAQVRDPESGQTMVVEFVDDQTAPDSRYIGDPAQVVDETHTTAGAVVKVFFGDYALEVVSDKQFKTEAELRWWAEQWFRRRRENFILGRGTIIGVPDLRARQTHELRGLAKAHNGDYYFARVNHKFGRDSGYEIDFSARKVL
jgi:phage protein D